MLLHTDRGPRDLPQEKGGIVESVGLGGVHEVYREGLAVPGGILEADARLRQLRLARACLHHHQNVEVEMLELFGGGHGGRVSCCTRCLPTMKSFLE